MNHNDLIILIGVITPLLVALVASAKWSDTAKGVAALVVSAAIGTATAYAGGALDAANIIGSTLAALGACQVAYLGLFKPIGVTSWILDNLGNVALPAPAPAKRPRKKGAR